MYSQAEEDDVLVEWLRALGRLRAPGTFIEIGSGSGYENNTRQLLDGGWRGQWIDCQLTRLLLTEDQQRRLTVTTAEITVANARSLIDLDLVPLDVLSIDIDGNDYWIAQQLLRLWPIVIIVEYNSGWDGEHRVMPYTPGYIWHQGQPFGASLLAWQALFSDYELVYTTRRKVNAFFVRRDVLRPQGGGAMRDIMEQVLEELAALREDLKKNEGRPSAAEIDNRLARLSTLLQTVQQNSEIPPQPPAALADNVVTFAPGEASIATVEEAMAAGKAIDLQPDGGVTIGDAPGVTAVEEEPSVLGAGVGESPAAGNDLPPEPSQA